MHFLTSRLLLNGRLALFAVALAATPVPYDSMSADLRPVRNFAGAETLGSIPADRWIGAPDGGLSGKDLLGSVVLVEFWTYLCSNCKNVEPWMKRAHAMYSEQGLRVIGVHTPEFEVERKVENVIAYMKENDITYPIAIDNGFKVWRKYNKTNAWPAFLVYDREGKLVYRKSGERAVTGATEAIEKALADGAPLESAESSGRGVVVTTETRRVDARSAVLEVSFAPRPGYMLLKSPPNEVRLELETGVTTPANPALLGDPFTGADSRDVRYYEGGASLAIPLELAPDLGGRTVDVRGTIVYHVCDEGSKVCARQEEAFQERIEAS